MATSMHQATFVLLLSLNEIFDLASNEYLCLRLFDISMGNPTNPKVLSKSFFRTNLGALSAQRFDYNHPKQE